MLTIPLTWRSDSSYSDTDVMAQHSLPEKHKAIKIVVEKHIKTKIVFKHKLKHKQNKKMLKKASLLFSNDENMTPLDWDASRWSKLFILNFFTFFSILATIWLYFQLSLINWQGRYKIGQNNGGKLNFPTTLLQINKLSSK